AGVRKTVEATEEQYAALEEGIRSMAMEIPASAAEIAGIAEMAGQLGIQTDNIIGFTRVMADLGNATNLTGEEAATTFAQFANITKMDQGDFDKLGSSIVALGNNFATTEADIAQMGKNLAAAGTQVGMSQADIMVWRRRCRAWASRRRRAARLFPRSWFPCRSRLKKAATR
ncbi:MAG: phage tail tape measure protein, partial [Saccharofermentanales bacterium]